MSMSNRFNTHHDRKWDDWLKAEGIVSVRPRLPAKPKRRKPLEGQLDLIEHDEDGKPLVHRKLPREKEANE